MEYYSAIKRNEIAAICSNVDGPRGIMFSKVRERQILYDITYIWSLKKIIQTNVYAEQKLTDIENKLVVTKWKAKTGGEIMNKGLRDDKLLYTI